MIFKTQFKRRFSENNVFIISKILYFSKHFEKIVFIILYSHIQFLLQTSWSLNHSAGFKPFSITISFKYLIPLFNHSLKNTGLFLNIKILLHHSGSFSNAFRLMSVLIFLHSFKNKNFFVKQGKMFYHSIII